MKIYVLHECIDSSDFYAEDNVIMVTKDKIKAIDKMVFLFNESKNDLQPVSDDETWCVATEASVVSGDSGNYYRHHWKIDEFEV
jgi:hypothetical protein|nr:MAG TPA: hypothetical protein [Caudoviricetes sp.]